MIKEVRDYLKPTKGVHKSESEKESCKNCIFHDKSKVCQIHMIKTNIDDTCKQIKKKRRVGVYRGGGVSPR